MQELAYGGWVAPNIYYLGYAGVIQVNGIRIGGISGIYKGYNYDKGHYEITPYNNDTVRSVYSIRNLEVFRLSQLTPSKVDIMLSHDWPSNIWEHGDGSRNGTKEGLLRFKPHFKDDIESGRLGSWPCWELLLKLKPRYWYSAHMHCRFDAVVKHDEEEKEGGEQTKFVALDKCLPRRQFFDFIDVGEEVARRDDGSAIIDLKYDAEWLAILTLTNKFLNCSEQRTRLPQVPLDTSVEDTPRWKFTPEQSDIDNVLKKFNNDLKIPENFTQTAAGYYPQWDRKNFHQLNQPNPVLNPQTTDFCTKLGIDDPLFVVACLKKVEIVPAIDHSIRDTAFEDTSEIPKKIQLTLPKPVNTEEIDLDDLEEEDDEGEKLSESKTEEIKQTVEKVEEVLHSEEKTTDEKVIKEEIKTETISVKRISEDSPIKTEDLIKIEPTPSANQTAAKKFKRRNQELRIDDEDE